MIEMTQAAKDAGECEVGWAAPTATAEYAELDNESCDDSPVVVIELSQFNKAHESNYDVSKNDCPDQILKSSSTIPWYQKNKGLLYILLSVICISCLNITVKIVSKSDERLPILELVFIRGIVGSLIVMIMMLQQNVPHWFGSPDAVRLLLFRGIFGFLALSFNFFALSMLSVGDATILSFFAPIFTGVLGSIFLKENWENIDKLAAFFSMIGVIFVARPPFLFGSYNNGVHDSILMPDEASMPAIVVDSEISSDVTFNTTSTTLNMDDVTSLFRRGSSPEEFDNSIQADLMRLAGVLMALIAAFCVAVALIIIRKVKNRSDPLQVVFYFHWMLIPFAIIFAPMVPKSMDTSSWMIPQKLETWSVVLLGTIFGTASQIFMTKGLQTETAAKASSMNYTQVIFAFTGEWIFWGLTPTSMTIFGCGIIIASMTFAAIYKNRINK